MKNRDRFTKTGYALMDTLIAAARLVPRWLLPAAVLAVALGIAIPSSSVSVQAQDGGTRQRAPVNFALEVVPESPFNPVCIGSTKGVQATVRQLVSAPGGASGTLRVGSPTIQYSYPDSILEDVTTTGDTFVWGNVLKEQTFSFRGRAEGSGSIDIFASIPTSTLLSLDDEVVLPITNNIPFEASVPVQVIPCDYDVSVSIVWNTTMGNANVVLIYSLRNTRVRFEHGVLREMHPILHTSSTANRIRGCVGPSLNYFDSPQRLSGQILEDQHIRLTLELYPQDASTLFTCRRPFARAEGISSCLGMPDGTCYPDIRRNDMWSVERLRVDIPMDGGSITVPLGITHFGGTATGSATVTLTPVERQ